MSANPEIAPGFKEKIVFTIQQHDILGVILAPYLVHANKLGEFGYFNQRLHLHTIPKHMRSLSEVEKQAIILLDECTDKHLTGKFSKNARTPAELWEQLDQSRINSLVVPYVQSRTNKCLILLRETGIPLHYKGSKSEHVRSLPIQIMDGEAKAVFHFEKDATGSRYRLNLRYATEDQTMNLGSSSRVLVNKPGWVLVNNKVYRLEDGVDGMKAKPFFTKEYISIPQSSEENYFRSFVTKAIQHYEVRLDGIELIENNPQCIPLLRLEHDWHGNPVMLLEFGYEKKRCKYPDKKQCWVDFKPTGKSFMFTKTIRDRETEAKTIDMLLNRGLSSQDMITFVVSSSNKNGEAPKAPVPFSKHQAFYKTAGQDRPDTLTGFGESVNLGEQLLHQTIDWLVTHGKPLRKYGFIIEQNFHKNRYYTGNVGIEFQFSEKIDWFDVYAVAVFGTHRIPFWELRNHLLNGIRQYALPDGEIAILPEEWFTKYGKLLVFGKTDKKSIRIQKHHFTIVNDLINDTDQPSGGQTGQAKQEMKVKNQNINERSEALLKLIKKESIPLPAIPRELKGVLRPYQVKGFAWMHLLGEHGFGGCLADDMGLGKTLQCLTLLWKHKLDHRPERLLPEPVSQAGLQLDLFNNFGDGPRHAASTSLVIMPLSLIHNWEKEIQKFTPGLRFIRYYGQNRESRPDVLLQHDIVLTTYGMVRNHLDFLVNIQFFYIILDESQLIKNPDSKVSRAVQRLQAKKRLVLTGTPIENTLTDLWAQINFLNPGLLGNRKFFQRVFVNPIEKAGQENNILKSIIEPFILRRTKALVEKDLPDLTEKVHYCEMDPIQKKLYESKKSEIRNSIFSKAYNEDKKGLRFDILRGLIQLRLIANHPTLASTKGKAESSITQQYMPSTDNDNELEPSGKFSEVIRIIENLRAEGHKLLIFSQFVKHLQIYRKHFDASNWDYAYLTGAQNTREREQMISAFRDDSKKKLFLISLKAGGTGLNLTEAGYVLLLDPWWNPAVEQQAISRAHRIGQKKPVIAYKFITKDTVEEKIMHLQQKKTNLATKIVGINDPFSFFSESEMMAVFE